MKCSECFHFEKIEGDDTFGLCLRNPPQVVKDYSGFTSKNPEVGINWRCGEFKPIKDFDHATLEIINTEGVTHLCPNPGSSYTACCGRCPFDLPKTDMITMRPDHVTCKGKA